MKFGEWAWSFRKLCIKKKKKTRQMQLVIINPTPIWNVLICNQCYSSLHFLFLVSYRKFLDHLFHSLVTIIIIISFCLNVTSFPAVLKKVNKSPSKIKCSNHISCSTITYTVYIYKYIHKYLTCTTNFEKGGEERTQKTYEDLWGWGEQGKGAQGCSLWG